MAGRQEAAKRPKIRVTTYDGPGADPVMREVPWPKVPPKGALIQIAACGVCGTDQHILKGHWPKPLPWPFTLGHELAGVVVEIGNELTSDFMGKPIGVGSKLMLPPLMPCGFCDWCKHYPERPTSASPPSIGRYLASTPAASMAGGRYVTWIWRAARHQDYTADDRAAAGLAVENPAAASALQSLHEAGGFSERHGGDPRHRPDLILASPRPAENGCGRVIAVGAQKPTLSWRALSARPPSTSRRTKGEARIRPCATSSSLRRRSLMDCSGHPSGAEGIEFCAMASTYVEMGQFTTPAISNVRHASHQDLNVLVSGPSANDLPLASHALHARDNTPGRNADAVPFTVAGVKDSVAQAMAMKTVKSTIVPFEELL